MYFSHLPRFACAGGVADGKVGGQVQTQISDVIEPTAEKLIPIAEELKDVYRQIELLEVSIVLSSLQRMGGWMSGLTD